MKKLALALFVAMQLCLHSCLPVNVGFDKNTLPNKGSTLFCIEYKDGDNVAQQIIQLLRSSRLADLDLFKNNFEDDRIEARFRTLTSVAQQKLKQDLQQVVGVLNVDIINDGLPTKNPFL